MKNWKRAIALVASGAALLSFAACGNGGNAEGGDDSKPTIGFVAVGPEGGFRTANENDLQDAFKKAGFDLTYSPTQNNDQQKQIQAFNKFVNDEVDAIVLSSTEDSGWDESLKKAKEAEIPVFTVDRDVDVTDPEAASAIVSHIGPSNEWAGEQAADFVNENFPDGANALRMIVVGAFDPQAIVGGAAGIGVREAMRFGVARGLFSNEAGMGSTPHAHAMAKVAKPQDQGIVAMICVFIDTFIVLTMTALVMLTSGALNVNNMAENPAAENMAQVAFTTVFQGFGNLYVAICLLFFAFSTVIGWYFFGAQNVKYLFGVKAVKVYACIAVVCVALGSMLEAPLVWNLSDLFNALMVFPNLIALLALSGVVAKMAREDDHDLRR